MSGIAERDGDEVDEAWLDEVLVTEEVPADFDIEQVLVTEEVPARRAAPPPGEGGDPVASSSRAPAAASDGHVPSHPADGPVDPSEDESPRPGIRGRVKRFFAGIFGG